MIIFIKKLKTKEGINSFDSEKIKKDIPGDYKALDVDPIITLTANHILIAYKCEKIIKNTPKPKPNAKPKANPKPSPKPKENSKPKEKSKKTEVATAD